MKRRKIVTSQAVICMGCYAGTCGILTTRKGRTIVCRREMGRRRTFQPPLKDQRRAHEFMNSGAYLGQRK